KGSSDPTSPRREASLFNLPGVLPRAFFFHISRLEQKIDKRRQSGTRAIAAFLFALGTQGALTGLDFVAAAAPIGALRPGPSHPLRHAGTADHRRSGRFVSPVLLHAS